MGKMSADSLDEENFKLVQQAWATRHEEFGELLDAYTFTQEGKGMTGKARRGPKLTAASSLKASSLKDWDITLPYRRKWGDEKAQRAKQMQRMSNQCFSSQRATLDGVKFTTADLATRSTRDNSHVKETYIDADTGERKDCYGRISKIIRHQLWPGEGAEELVMIKCDWFTPVGGPNPRNGLVTVQHAPNFTEYSPWSCLKDMHRLNISLWPTHSSYCDDQDQPAVTAGYFDVVEHGRHVENSLEYQEEEEGYSEEEEYEAARASSSEPEEDENASEDEDASENEEDSREEEESRENCQDPSEEDLDEEEEEEEEED
jgi:hypothetical protein